MQLTPAVLQSPNTALKTSASLILGLLFVPSVLAFNPGEKVTLTRDEPLLFREQQLRVGKAGQEFTVLADRPEQKKVYLSSTDAGGHQIAIVVSPEALKSVPIDPIKSKRAAIAAAKANKFEEAHRTVLQALAANPADAELLRVRDKLSDLEVAAKQVGAAKEDVKRVAAAAAQKRKNAAVTDRPNPLNPNDNSNRDRAAKIREDADQIEERANLNLRLAREKYEELVASLSDSDASNASRTAEIRPAGEMIKAQPGVELTPAKQAQNRGVQDRQDAAEKEQRLGLERTLSQWTKDEAIVPDSVKKTSDGPTYQETLEFINGMIAGNGQRMWFGKMAGKMILESANDIITFDPTTLTPEVKFSTASDENGRQQVQLFCTNGRTQMKWISKWTGETQDVNGLKLFTGDNIDRDKLAKACVHLIRIFGGKVDAF